MSSSNHRDHADYSEPAKRRCMICGRVTSELAFITSDGEACCSTNCILAHNANLNIKMAEMRRSLKARRV